MLKIFPEVSSADDKLKRPAGCGASEARRWRCFPEGPSQQNSTNGEQSAFVGAAVLVWCWEKNRTRPTEKRTEPRDVAVHRRGRCAVENLYCRGITVKVTRNAKQHGHPMVAEVRHKGHRTAAVDVGASRVQSAVDGAAHRSLGDVTGAEAEEESALDSGLEKGVNLGR